jgi:CBS domain-containing protein
MVDNKFSGLPVVNRDQQVVGVISAVDILRYTLDLLDRVEGK